MLDTNVVSEMMKPREQRSQAVVDWFRRQPGEQLFLSTITVAEILAGIAIMPDGQRRAGKAEATERVLALFESRVLPFELAATEFYAEAVTIRRRQGKSIDRFDMLIGAICRANRMAVATRNTADFDGCGIGVIDPWEA